MEPKHGKDHGTSDEGFPADKTDQLNRVLDLEPQAEVSNPTTSSLELLLSPFLAGAR